MAETKKCPYCGEEILAVAKKCKHCGEWLDKEELPISENKNAQESHSNRPLDRSNAVKPVIPAASAKSVSVNQKNRIVYCIAGVLIIGAIIIAISLSKSSSSTMADETESDMVEIQEVPIDDYESETSETGNRYSEKLAEISGIADNAVKYSDGRYIWYNQTTPWGYSKELTVYDSETDNTSYININKTSSSDDMMTVHAISEHNGKITVILEENRNSNGWIEGTYVWTIDCSSRNWKCIANGVAGAEIINNGGAVKIKTATTKNPDDPTFMQEYNESTKTISL